MLETLFAQELSLEVMTVRLVLSLVVGGLIGLERERHDQPAGFRTHTLISVGATVLMFVSIAVPSWYTDAPGGDPGRIAAQVVSGIGFLGAGAIIKFGADVRGLTTAASVWTVAALGLAIGAGLYLPTLIAGGLIMFTLVVLNRFEKHFFRQRLVKTLVVETWGTEMRPEEVTGVLEGMGIGVRTVNVDRIVETGRTVYRYFVYLPRTFDFDTLYQELLKRGKLSRVAVEETR